MNWLIALYILRFRKTFVNNFFFAYRSKFLNYKLQVLCSYFLSPSVNNVCEKMFSLPAQKDQMLPVRLHFEQLVFTLTVEKPVLVYGVFKIIKHRCGVFRL